MSDEHKPAPPPKCSAKTASGRPCQRAALRGSTRCWTHSFKVPGRPTKLKQETQERILDAVLEGNYLETAAQVVGVNKTTLYRWLRRADELEAQAAEHDDDSPTFDPYEHIDPAEWVYLNFRHALKSAEAFAETELLRRASSGGMGWQAPMTVLERRHPQRWRRRDSRELEVSGGLTAKVETVEPVEDKRREIAAILSKSGALAAGENTTEEDHDGDND